jgi:hypothetical protein
MIGKGPEKNKITLPVKDGINKVTEYMNTLKADSDSKMNLFNAKIEVEGHILRVNNAINELQRKLDILMDSVVNTQKGIIQPQVISPLTLMESLL